MTDWQDRARCIDVHPDVMFPGTDRADIAAAKAICRLCPVKADCLEYALANGEREGVWGGLAPAERWPLRRRWIADRGLELTASGHVRQGHGTRTCYQRGCRRPECREAQRAYEAARRA